MNESTSIEDLILARVLPIVEERVEERLESLRREMARDVLYTVVSAGELASIIGLSRNSVHRKVAKGELPTELVNGTHYFDLKEILNQADECNFKNTKKVRDAIEGWINSKINKYEQ